MNELDPVTRHVATRLRELRRGSGMTQADVAEAMQEHGVPWKRGTVVYAETGKREGISVQELAALALVFRVSVHSLLPSDLCSQCQGNPPVGYTCTRCGQA